jgi:hypothetical protein
MTENGGWASDGDSNIGSILLKILSDFVTEEEGGTEACDEGWAVLNEWWKKTEDQASNGPAPEVNNPFQQIFGPPHGDRGLSSTSDRNQHNGLKSLRSHGTLKDVNGGRYMAPGTPAALPTWRGTTWPSPPVVSPLNVSFHAQACLNFRPFSLCI